LRAEKNDSIIKLPLFKKNKR